MSSQLTRPSASEAMAARPTATASRAWRPSTPEASSSACPESSWLRELRTTTRIAISPANIEPSIRARQALKPSGVIRSRAWPKTRPSAGLMPRLIESWARSAVVSMIQR
ncbi:hypothetical protein ACFP54_14555 [Luteococcus peritonei]|uniref:hypothetical protein n=1 Tax=Luteococcus peritonei TaxID=88874 RepID=UPI0031E3A92D